jgi:3-hydroxy-9,10-secoandrosta-1,3,5(10)-triene-9,17-dione monooxygenase reductase component
MATSIDPTYFRSVLGRVPTSVVVVTGCDAAGQPHGITIGTFVSVSLDPPLIGFLPTIDSTTWAAIEPSGSFCVNVLAVDQEELCWQFAKDTEHRFQGVKWNPAPSGSPIIQDCVAWIDCSLHSVTEVGDHYFVVGQTEHMAPGDDNRSAMIFSRGKIAGIDPNHSSR